MATNLDRLINELEAVKSRETRKVSMQRDRMGAQPSAKLRAASVVDSLTSYLTTPEPVESQSIVSLSNTC